MKRKTKKLLIRLGLIMHMLPVLVFSWLAIFDLAGLTETQWTAALITAGISALGLLITIDPRQ